ncbi:NUDIX hydrolase [Streptomyces abyssomicinicus]|uniref:NUDIX hydrolase n=1 Tax=Streptomyces abyssomicinicus TaxID=574929 RepID=UPI0012500F83|nr:NUDIX domain-containing protein [Streptomyces abyssomicinicus]
MAEAPTGRAVPRSVVRVVVLDPDDRILLLRGHGEGDHWAMPGGGVEPGETPAGAALRELAEETGITGVEAGPLLWRQRVVFRRAGRLWDSDEWYCLVRGDRSGAGRIGPVVLERPTFAEARWWTCGELGRSHETVYPRGLAGLLRRLLDEGPPAGPETLAPEIA